MHGMNNIEATSLSMMCFVGRYVQMGNLLIQGLRVVYGALYFVSIRACRGSTVGVRLLYETR
jgi:hypothetical protein